MNVEGNEKKLGHLPLVYSCSGCSSAAQTANYLALRLDREGQAEMSCIAGVGGNVPHLVKIAGSGRPILAIDGCRLACTLNCLSQRGLSASRHVILQEYGVKKRYHADINQSDAELAYNGITEILIELKVTQENFN